MQPGGQECPIWTISWLESLSWNDESRFEFNRDESLLKSFTLFEWRASEDSSCVVNGGDYCFVVGGGLISLFNFLCVFEGSIYEAKLYLWGFKVYKYYVCGI